ncbi:MAG: cyclase family protein [Methanobacteriota archaeon]
MSSVVFRRVVDLSQEISADTQMFPAYPPPTFLPWTTREAHGFLAEAVLLASHTGTHVDAPLHCIPGGRAIHGYRAGRFVAPARLLDVRPPRARGRIDARALRRALKGTPLRRGEAAIVRTGWEATRGRRAYLTDHPGLTVDAARALASWGASFAGVDTANIDHPDAPRLVAHEILLDAGVLVVENLANLGAVRADAFTLLAHPLRLRGATGSPIRAVALV